MSENRWKPMLFDSVKRFIFHRMCSRKSRTIAIAHKPGQLSKLLSLQAFGYVSLEFFGFGLFLRYMNGNPAG